MQRIRVLAVCVAVSASSAAFAEEVKLPPEVTPALRAACESDVRRIGCVDATPTYSEVKSCVIVKYAQLGKRCKVELASAGYSGPVERAQIRHQSRFHQSRFRERPILIKAFLDW